jgi:hypothetical protein
MARARLLAMARWSCRLRQMVEWSGDHVVAIGSLNSNFGLVDRTWLNWRPVGALRWKVETVGWEGRQVVCGMSAHPRL